VHQLQEPRAAEGVEETQEVLQVPGLSVRQVHEDGGDAQELRGTDGQAQGETGGRAARTGASAEPVEFPGREADTVSGADLATAATTAAEAATAAAATTATGVRRRVHVVHIDVSVDQTVECFFVGRRVVDHQSVFGVRRQFVNRHRRRRRQRRRWRRRKWRQG